MALTDTSDTVADSHSLQVDHFGLSIGPLSVGLPPARTADDLYRRYLDLVDLLRRGSVPMVRPAEEDAAVLAIATGTDVAFVLRRLRALGAG
ncbi:MAG: hypothetical protein RIB98_19125 [Acidimicrobiales bacterium]